MSTNKTVAHTATPWRVADYRRTSSGVSSAVILGNDWGNDVEVAQADSNNDAAFIVQACNAHEMLVEELGIVVRWMDENVADPAAITIINGARAALAAANGGAK